MHTCTVPSYCRYAYWGVDNYEVSEPISSAVVAARDCLSDHRHAVIFLLIFLARRVKDISMLYAPISMIDELQSYLQ